MDSGRRVLLTTADVPAGRRRPLGSDAHHSAQPPTSSAKVALTGSIMHLPTAACAYLSRAAIVAYDQQNAVSECGLK
jgi:hypothetical protein